MSLTIGQHVRHRDHKGQRVTGTVRSIGIEDNAVMVTIGLDAPIVIPKRGELDREIHLYTQHVPAHELAPFDERDELLAGITAQTLAFTETVERFFRGGDGSDPRVPITEAEVSNALYALRAAVTKASEVWPC
jgi:hypothetical protein